MAIKSFYPTLKYRISLSGLAGCRLVSGLLPGRGRCPASAALQAAAAGHRGRDNCRSCCRHQDTGPPSSWGAGGGQASGTELRHSLKLRSVNHFIAKFAVSWPHNDKFSNNGNHQNRFSLLQKNWHLFNIIATFHYSYFLFNRPIPFDTFKWFRQHKNQTRIFARTQVVQHWPGQSPVSADLGEEEPGQTDDWDTGISSLLGIEELQFSISFCQFREKI